MCREILNRFRGTLKNRRKFAWNEESQPWLSFLQKTQKMLKHSVYPGVWMRTAQGNFCWGSLHHWKESATWNSFLPKSLRSPNNSPTEYLSIAYKINLFYISLWKFWLSPWGNLNFFVDSCPETLETKYLLAQVVLSCYFLRSFFQIKQVTGKRRYVCHLTSHYRTDFTSTKPVNSHYKVNIVTLSVTQSLNKTFSFNVQDISKDV